jgi:hypothetical protein
MISIFLAPASIEFSINSLTTEAGLSTTSPAAIWSTSLAGRTLTFDNIFVFVLISIL